MSESIFKRVSYCIIHALELLIYKQMRGQVFEVFLGLFHSPVVHKCGIGCVYFEKESFRLRYTPINYVAILVLTVSLIPFLILQDLHQVTSIRFKR